MSILIRRSCMILLALPVAALADPVAVTTHSTGTSTVDNTILSALGLNSVATTAPLPYELTLRSTFDPGSDPLWPPGWAYDFDSEVVIDFRIGSQVYHYDGTANSSVNRVSVSIFDSYEHNIWFTTAGPPDANYTVHFHNRLYDLPGSMGLGGPLTPFDANESSGENVFGYYTINATPSNPDVPLSWSMQGPPATLSVHVAVVPEPASFVLLAAGLLTLGLRRRFGRVPM
ncbi:PEP-CTERM sorting domain-containing protein [Massilia niastensis]|uniref:PEP-CTERM sorting domain-containing protein n=1 Tax=Massilia niastensis TaxID=544911 RepID=UPI00036C09C4|nr:PEP-CTERM sorting domain-containing protein [Massilia niastensis]